jgi:hypothetical protein
MALEAFVQKLFAKLGIARLAVPNGLFEIAGQDHSYLSRCWRFLMPPPSRIINRSPSLPKQNR